MPVQKHGSTVREAGLEARVSALEVHVKDMAERLREHEATVDGLTQTVADLRSQVNERETV